MTYGIRGLTPTATCFRRIRGWPTTHVAAEPRQQVAVGVSPRIASRPPNHGFHFVRQAAKTATARWALRSRAAIASVPAAAVAATNGHNDVRDPWAHAHGLLGPHLAIEQPVVNRLGKMMKLNCLRLIEVRNGSRHAEDLVVGAGR